jgi:hypothetical protein
VNRACSEGVGRASVRGHGRLKRTEPFAAAPELKALRRGELLRVYVGGEGDDRAGILLTRAAAGWACLAPARSSPLAGPKPKVAGKRGLEGGTRL